MYSNNIAKPPDFQIREKRVALCQYVFHFVLIGKTKWLFFI